MEQSVIDTMIRMAEAWGALMVIYGVIVWW